MRISVYVDGSGGSDSGYGYFVKETGESFYEKKSEITNNQAEYLAIISALNKYVNSNDEITIFYSLDYIASHGVLRAWTSGKTS